MNYQAFIFEDYVFDIQAKTLNLHYSFDGRLFLTETYRFNFDFVDFDTTALDRAVQLLFFMAGVSYFKAYLPQEIQLKKGDVDQNVSNFLSKTYKRGLGEFFYINQLDPRTNITFPVTTTQTLNTLSIDGEGQLAGLGGGKDSLVSVELLRNQPKIATWSVGHQAQLEPLVSRIDLTHFWVEREWDKQLLNLPNTYNGHIPISAILACVGSVVAILAGYHDVVVSNESTASEPNLTYQDTQINHQYSKSLEFEQDFQAILEQHFGDSLRYYSLLRPYTELRIAEIFAKTGFDKYKDVFSSCNRAFVHTSNTMSWCGQCAKCAFVFLALTPFIERTKLETLWGGKNLLLDPELEPTYRQLLGIQGTKPLDCVGEIKESRAAMRIAQSQYPELLKYMFDLPDNYNFRAVSQHSIPEDIVTFVL